MAEAYGLGNFNASLIATEGRASAGIYLAPASAFLCGLVISLGNVVSAKVSPGFVLVSSAMVVLNLMNVPLSTALVTNGGLALLILWYVSPVELFSDLGGSRSCRRRCVTEEAFREF